jgi:DNA-binding transcriptional regulator YdaS (Cro superfamily)
MSHSAFQRALACFDGNQSAMARAIGTSQQRIHYLVSNEKGVPAELTLATEAATGISRHELRPDIYPREPAQAA